MEFSREGSTSLLDPNTLDVLLQWLHLLPAESFTSGCYQVNTSTEQRMNNLLARFHSSL